MVLHRFVDVWSNCAPEVASICNRNFTENTKISLLGILLYALEDSLSPLGYPKSSYKEPDFDGPSLKEIGYQILGMLCNIILLAVIVGLGNLVFG